MPASNKEMYLARGLYRENDEISEYKGTVNLYKRTLLYLFSLRLIPRYSQFSVIADNLAGEVFASPFWSICMGSSLPRTQSLLRRGRGGGGRRKSEKNWGAKHHGKGLEGIAKEQALRVSLSRPPSPIPFPFSSEEATGYEAGE